MKRLLVVCALFSALAAPAAAAPDEWLGYFCITSNPLPAACVADGIGLGECATLRYAPPTAANGSSARVSLFEAHWAENYTAAGTLASSTLVPVSGTGVAAGVWTFNASMKFTQTPPTVTAATKTISFTGNAKDFDGAAGCNITFTAAATHRPPG